MAEVFDHPVRVRWRDMDALGHVNHAVFLTFLEEGRDAFYARFLGDPAYVVVRLEVDLRSEVRQEDQQVTVQIAVERVGTASLTTRETVLKAGNVVAAQARVVTVRWDAAGHQAVPFADGHRQVLRALAG
jgi:acyl-CoA thioester hydrolase